MPRWNEEQLREFLQRSPARRPDHQAEVQAPKPQPIVRPEPLGEAPRKSVGEARIRVSVTSRRCRLLDPDNVCPKYVIDLLRYGGVLRDDSPDLIELEIRQEKVRTKEEEETVIHITP